MTQEQGNQLIAEFEGARFVNDDVTAYPDGYLYFEDIGAMEIKNLMYHTSWDWLMPIVEKISQIKMENDPDGDTYHLRTFGMIDIHTKNPMVRFNCYSLFQATTLIQATWTAVVDFITHQNSLHDKRPETC